MAAMHWAPGGRRKAFEDFGTLGRRRQRQNGLSAISGAVQLDLGLAISGMRPASAASRTRKKEAWQQSLLHAPVVASASSLGRVSADSKPAEVPQIQVSTGPKEHQEEEESLMVSLVSSLSGETLGTAVIRDAIAADSLRQRFGTTHLFNQDLKSTIEIWNGDVAGSAEGVVQIVKKSRAWYEISHNFLELSNAPGGVALTITDSPETRLILQGTGDKVGDERCPGWHRAALTIEAF
jgi:hypothetical protein